MKKFFEYKSGSMLDESYGKKDTAYITIGNYISGFSSYRGGTYDHMVYIHIKIGRFDYRNGWSYQSTRGSK